MQKQKKNKTRLRLERNIVRDLTPTDLTAVVGGCYTTSDGASKVCQTTSKF